MLHLPACRSIVFKEILLLAFPNENCFFHLEMGQGSAESFPYSVSGEMTHDLTEGAVFRAGQLGPQWNREKVLVMSHFSKLVSVT
jgi:hypothetical protein